MDYKVWAEKTTKAWLREFITHAVGKRCDGTWGPMSSARFIETQNPQELIDELVNGIYTLMFGEDGSE